MKKLMTRLYRDEKGQGLAEYGLILGLIAVACIFVLTALAGGIQNVLGLAEEELSGVEVPTQ